MKVIDGILISVSILSVFFGEITIGLIGITIAYFSMRLDKLEQEVKQQWKRNKKS